MNTRWFRFGMLLFALTMSFPNAGWTDEGPEQADTDRDPVDPNLDFMMRQANSYTGTRTEDQAKLTPLPKPLLRWTNPLLGIDQGLYVAWTDPSGRPMSVAQIYYFPPSKKWFIEHQSLCDGPMEFRSDISSDWSPEKPGITWTKFGNDAVAPSDSKTRRMAEMRNLARRFRAEDTIANNSELRLLPNPMLRYEAPKSGLVDGAMFVMVNGTDPEITVQIEARKDANTLQTHYYWALSPMTTYELTAYIEDRKVWHVESTRPTGKRDVFHPHELAGGVE